MVPPYSSLIEYPVRALFGVSGSRLFDFFVYDINLFPVPRSRRISPVKALLHRSDHRVTAFCRRMKSARTICTIASQTGMIRGITQTSCLPPID